MKYYILSSTKYEKTFEYFTNLQVNEDTLYKNIHELEDKSLILTDLHFDNDEIKWFNNDNFNLDNEINKLIILKKLVFVRYNKVINGEMNLFDLFEYLIRMNEDMKFFDYKEREKDNILKKLKGKKTCVCIGNGSNQTDGKTIDSMDVVVRVNNLKIKGYENIVGSKTDIYYRGSSPGMCDTCILEDNTCLKLTHSGLWNKSEKDWLYSGYFMKVNWYKLFRTVHFNFYKEIESKCGTGINGSGMISILLILKTILFNNLYCKLFTVGYNGYTGADKYIQKDGYINDPTNNPYYFDQPCEEVKYASSTNDGGRPLLLSERFDLVMMNYQLLVDNKIIFNLTE